ncbi:hypothetical protein Tco_0605306, partial [Tanacetum coccineum]
MSRTIPPMGENAGKPSTSNPNRVENIHVDTTNTMTTTNVTQNVADENLPQLLDSRGDSHVTNVLDFDKENFTSWKVRFLVFLDGLEPYLLKIIEDGPFVPMSSMSTFDNPLPKRQNQWSHAESHLANQDKRLKTHEGPSDTRDTKIAASQLKFNAFKSLEDEKVNGTFTRLKCLLNDLENNGAIIPQADVNATFVNSMPRKCDSNVEEDLRRSNEFMADLNAEYHERALMANQKRFYKRKMEKFEEYLEERIWIKTEELAEQKPLLFFQASNLPKPTLAQSGFVSLLLPWSFYVKFSDECQSLAIIQRIIKISEATMARRSTSELTVFRCSSIVYVADVAPSAAAAVLVRYCNLQFGPNRVIVPLSIAS